MVDACESEQSALLREYVLSKKQELELLASAEDSAAGPKSISPFVPCAASRIPYILQAARICANDVLWDLGCGDGVVLLEAARRCGCRCVGLDIDAPCIATAQERSEKLGISDRCQWLRFDLLQLPIGTLSRDFEHHAAQASSQLDQELKMLEPPTVALIFLTAHGLVRIAPWLHDEWRRGTQRRLRLVTCVESLDTAVDFNDPAAIFSNMNELQWPVCRDYERWGVFVVPPFGEEVGAWSGLDTSPLHLTREESEVTRPTILSSVLDEEEVKTLDFLGRKQVVFADKARGGLGEEPSIFDLSVDEAGSFHAAAEAALHNSVVEHRVLYLHSDEVCQRLSPDEVGFLDTLEKKMLQCVTREDANCWGLLRNRSVSVRSFEYHAYSNGGSVMDPEHRDDGSLLTLSVLLSHPDDFQGGTFNTFDGYGNRIDHKMGRGDGILFVSEKRHNVSTVIGDRRVLVMELWDKPRNQHNRHF